MREFIAYMRTFESDPRDFVVIVLAMIGATRVVGEIAYALYILGHRWLT
jgi:hypothetical protein